MSEHCREVTSEIRKGEPTILIWNVKGWKEKTILWHCSCLLDVGVEGSGRCSSPLPSGQLRFSFGEWTEKTEEYDNISGCKNKVGTKWLLLNVEQKRNEGDRILQYELQVDLLDSQGAPLDNGGETSIRDSIGLLDEKGEKKPKLEGSFDFIKLRKGTTSGSTGDKSTVEIAQPDELRLRIAVTPTYIAEEINVHPEEERLEGEEEISLCQALKAMFISEENYSDLQLEMKDGMKLSAHKFILAARSPVLRARIAEAVSGAIPLAEVNAKPMVAILHWMYSGELHENAGKCLEEVVDAAILFQLAELLKVLDKKMIGICNEENMFKLYKRAQKNGMLVAKADIAKFITKNVRAQD